MKALINFSHLSIFRTGSDPDEKIRQLDREKHRLMLQAHTLFHQLHLSNHELFQSAKSDAETAAEQLSTARRSHPALKLLFLKNDAARRRIDKMRMNGKGLDRALARLEGIRADLDQATSTIPKLRELAKKGKAGRARCHSCKMGTTRRSAGGHQGAKYIETLDLKIDRLQHEPSGLI